MKVDHLLQQTGWFKGLSKESREALAAVCSRKTIRKKEILFSEGQNGQALFLLAQGNVQLHKTGPDGRETIIRVVKPGEIFAEVILFEKDSYPVTAVALKSGVVYQLPKNRFNELLAEETFRTDFIRTLLEKHRYLAAKILQITTYDVRDRFFLFLKEQFGSAEEMAPGLSKKAIADAIGATPETLSRLLRRLRHEGVLSWKGRKIRLRKGFWKNREF